MLHVQRSINTIFASVSYAISHGKLNSFWLVDVGDVNDNIRFLSRGSLVRGVFLTHAHFDHIYGLNELMKLSPASLVYTNEIGREMLLDAKKNLSFYHESPFVFEHPDRIKVVNDGDELSLGNGLTAKAVFTPGHNPSCITWVIDDAVFSGDSLIPGIKTVTNLPGGNRSLAKDSEDLIRQLAIGRTIVQSIPAIKYSIYAKQDIALLGAYVGQGTGIYQGGV